MFFCVQVLSFAVSQAKASIQGAIKPGATRRKSSNKYALLGA